MEKQKWIKHIVPIFLAAVLLFGAFPLSTAAQNKLPDEAVSPIVSEVTDLREESVKHFLCEDGTYIAATYATPVHYEENGKWKEIDNSLTLTDKTLSASGKPTYAPRAGGLQVSIPQSFSDGQQITASNKGYTISFGVKADGQNVSLKKAATVVDAEALPSNTHSKKSAVAQEKTSASDTTSTAVFDNEGIIKYNDDVMSVKNQSGAVVYKDIFSKADLEYIVTANSVKENIVVYEPQKKYIYRFDMDLDGLLPILQEDGSINLVKKENTDDVVFLLQAPYMYDANGEESFDIKMSLEANGKKHLLTLEASAEWLNSADRAFPVVIDPTFNFLNSAFNDVFVMNGVYANSTRRINELRVGRNLTNNTRTYIEMVLPTHIPTGSVVTQAMLILKQSSYYQAPLQSNIAIRVYDCQYEKPWSPDNVTWNNQPFSVSNNGYEYLNPVLLDSKNANSGAGSYTFNITNAVNHWINCADSNKGLMIASSDESSKTQVDFHSSRVSTISNRPEMWFDYSTPSISQTVWNTEAEVAVSPVINVTSSLIWTATANQSWLSVSDITSSSFKINAEANPNAYVRTGTVTVTMGGTVIGTINVTQLGTDPSLTLDTSAWAVKDQSGTKTVSIASNANWTIASDVPSWLTVSPSNGTGNSTFTITAGENAGNTTRTGTVTVQAGDMTETIAVTQFDEVSGYFNQINDDGSFSFKSSSDYNHPLATWAMGLSYAAYNPVPNGFAEIVPGAFMQFPYNDPAKDAKAELESNGFDDVTKFNYGEPNNVAAHVIGHRDIVIGGSDEQSTLLYTNNITGGNNNGNAVNNLGCDSDWVWVSDNSNSSNYSSDVRVTGGVVELDNQPVLSLELPDNSGNTRSLVVVVVRGSVTLQDWLMNARTQLNLAKAQFDDGSDMVYKTLYGDAENCTECNGEGCDACRGYLAQHNLTNPIILITGHSLGAAIANLTAEKLNSDVVQPQGEEPAGSEDVFAYTFATPNTVNEADEGSAAIHYTNIFNIMNNNDAVTYMPRTLNPLNWNTDTWFRYGQDFHITMPMEVSLLSCLDTALLGLGGHAMPTYLTWMENLPEKLDKSADAINVDDMEAMTDEGDSLGLLPKILRVACPVGVTLYDDSGNIIACENQGQSNNPQPMSMQQPDNSGVVSWIAYDGARMFFIPYGGDTVEARVEAYDYGTMTFTAETLGAGEPLESKTFNNVNLFPGKEFVAEISEDISIEDTQLFVTEDGEVVGEVTDLNPLLKSAAVDNTNVPYGTLSTVTVVTDRTVSKVQFIDRSNGATQTFDKFNPAITSLVDNGETLTWTIQRVFSRGEFVYDVAVKVGYTWYPPTERVFALTVT